MGLNEPRVFVYNYFEKEQKSCRRVINRSNSCRKTDASRTPWIDVPPSWRCCIHGWELLLYASENSTNVYKVFWRLSQLILALSSMYGFLPTSVAGKLYSFASFLPGNRLHCDVIPVITWLASIFVLRPDRVLRKSGVWGQTS